MPLIPADTRRADWEHAGGAGSFRPNGKLQLHSVSEFVKNPQTWKATGTAAHAARLFVGFNVGGEPTWKIEQLIALVREVRRTQGAREDSSFVAQKGVYTHTNEETGVEKVIEEDGAQVILFKMPSETVKLFKQRVVELAEIICRQMQQAEVVVELQRGGVVQSVFGIQA